jgi:hypothetical protein
LLRDAVESIALNIAERYSLFRDWLQCNEVLTGIRLGLATSENKLTKDFDRQNSFAQVTEHHVTEVGRLLRGPTQCKYQ